MPTPPSRALVRYATGLRDPLKAEDLRRLLRAMEDKILELEARIRTLEEV